jgi:hypothetical protein
MTTNQGVARSSRAGCTSDINDLRRAVESAAFLLRQTCDNAVEELELRYTTGWVREDLSNPSKCADRFDKTPHAFQLDLTSLVI